MKKLPKKVVSLNIQLLNTIYMLKNDRFGGRFLFEFIPNSIPFCVIEHQFVGDFNAGV